MRKKKLELVKDTSLSEEVIQIIDENKEKEEGISLNVIEATDTNEPPKKSTLKDSIRSLFVTEEEVETKSKRKRKSSFFQKHLYLFTGVCIFLCNVVWPETWKEIFLVEDKEYSLSPSQEHIQSILEPLARIADRHTNIADLNPDVTDVLSSITAIVAYGIEIRSVLVLKKYYEQEKKKEQEKEQMNRRMSYAFN